MQFKTELPDACPRAELFHDVRGSYFMMSAIFILSRRNRFTCSDDFCFQVVMFFALTHVFQHKKNHHLTTALQENLTSVVATTNSLVRKKFGGKGVDLDRMSVSNSLRARVLAFN